MKVYLAGKVRKNCWRHDLVPELRSAADYPIWDASGTHGAMYWPQILGGLLGGHTYVGPYFISCDHGCAHGSNTHGVGASEVYEGCFSVNGPTKQHTVDLCLSAIDDADVVFAWIDPEALADRLVFTGYGTLFELGYAAANGKRIVLAMPKPNEDTWFAQQFAEAVLYAPTAKEAWIDWERMEHIRIGAADLRHRLSIARCANDED